MPELPEVETMVRGIRSGVLGRKIERVEFCRCERKPIQISPPIEEFADCSENCWILDVRRLAKRVLIDLTTHCPPFPTSVPICRHIVIEPRMTGLMLISDPPTREHRRICWHLQPAAGLPESLEFWDRRGLGTVRLITSEELKGLSDRLGPDALKMTADDWQSALRKTDRPVKVALLDQSLIAGIGNLYASEILHLAGINPCKPSSTLRLKQVKAICNATISILTEAIKYEGSTLSDGTWRNALNQNGGYQNHHQVYARESEACPSCGTAILRIVQAQRSTFFCPRCQR